LCLGVSPRPRCARRVSGSAHPPCPSCLHGSSQQTSLAAKKYFGDRQERSITRLACAGRTLASAPLLQRIDESQPGDSDEGGVVTPEFARPAFERAQCDLEIEDTIASDLEIRRQLGQPKAEARPGRPDLGTSGGE